MPADQNSFDVDAVRKITPPPGLPFDIRKIGHVVLHVADMERAAAFYVGVLGFEISDVYGDDLMPGGMIFMRFSPDHHGVALVSGGENPSQNREFHHMAFEVGSLDEVIRARNHLAAAGAVIDFDGRRRAGCQIAVEFRDPDGHRLEIYWGLDQIGTDGVARPADQWKGAPTIKAAIADPVEGQDLTVQDKSLV